MKKSDKSCLLVVGKRSCFVALPSECLTDGAVVDFQDGDLIGQIENVVSALLPLVQSNKQIVIGLDSDLCLPATIGVATPQMLRKPRILHYHLEEWLPWSAEDFVSDFVGHRNSAFAVALETDGVQALAGGLREAGFDIAAMSPLPLLALNGLQEQTRLPKNCMVIWQDESHIDLMALRDNKPYSWQRIAASETDLLRHLSLSKNELTKESPVVPVQLAKTLVDVLTQNEIPVHDVPQDSVLASGFEFSQKVVAGNREPSIDLQKDALAGLKQNQRLRFEWALLSVAILVSACVVSGTLWVKAQEIGKAQLAVETELEELYREVDPEGPMPERIGVAINNEHRRLKGAQEIPKEVPVAAAADFVLEKVLKLFPARLRFRVPEITVENNRVSIGAQVRSIADADLIANSMRGGGFEIKAPRTRRLADKGVSARISGELVEEEPE